MLISDLNVKHFFSRKEAMKLANELNETDEWWLYKVVNDESNGLAFIEVYDEDNKYIGVM